MYPAAICLVQPEVMSLSSTDTLVLSNTRPFAASLLVHVTRLVLKINQKCNVPGHAYSACMRLNVAWFFFLSPCSG